MILRLFLTLGLTTRASYFLLIANDVLKQSMPANMAMAELPYVFFFTGLSSVICLWALFNFVRYLKHTQTAFWISFVMVNAVVSGVVGCVGIISWMIVIIAIIFNVLTLLVVASLL